LRGHEHSAFGYRDEGNLATIGRAAAVADIKGARLSGFHAWTTWLVVHLWYLIGLRESAARPHPLVVQLRDPRS
jgi:NADH:quinone reductase (non-electrogenic)